jgi:inorganic triphosphatase YgiF
MAPRADTEVELKFAIGSEGARAAAGREVGRAPSRSVETVYFDTPERRLKSAGYSLRLRRDGERWSQSVKSGDGAMNRFEQDHAVRAGLPDFSLLEGTPIASLVKVADRLSPVFVTRVQRRSRRRATEGGRIEFSLDEGEVIAHNKSWPILELELELKSGRAEALFDEGRRLASGEAFTPAFMSKAERGYALADGILGQPVKFGSHPLAGETPCADAFKVLARRCLRQLTLNADLIAAGVRLEAVHQARTALRRLRVVVGLFKPVVDEVRAEALERELEWLTGELADARNLDVVLTDTFEAGADQAPDRDAAAALGRQLMQAHHRAYERARLAVADQRFRLLLLDAAHWLEGDVTPAIGGEASRQPVADFAIGALDDRRDTLLKKLGDLDWDDPFERHKARIAAKKMRYASEFFVGLGSDDGGGPPRRFIKTLTRLQADLGELNDITVGRSLILDLIADAEGSKGVGYAAGVMVGYRLAAARKVARSARRAARAFKKAKTWW